MVFGTRVVEDVDEKQMIKMTLFTVLSNESISCGFENSEGTIKRILDRYKLGRNSE